MTKWIVGDDSVAHNMEYIKRIYLRHVEGKDSIEFQEFEDEVLQILVVDNEAVEHVVFEEPAMDENDGDIIVNFLIRDFSSEQFGFGAVQVRDLYDFYAEAEFQEAAKERGEKERALLKERFTVISGAKTEMLKGYAQKTETDKDE